MSPLSAPAPVLEGMGDWERDFVEVEVLPPVNGKMSEWACSFSSIDSVSWWRKDVERGRGCSRSWLTQLRKNGNSSESCSRSRISRSAVSRSAGSGG